MNVAKVKGDEVMEGLLMKFSLKKEWQPCADDL
jgi:hypothetical protein